MPATRRANIGFQGGQVLALKLSDAELTKLTGALGSSGWHETISEDGTVRIDLSQVVYVSADSEEPRVGFG
jgi:hypothetical protein